MKPVIVDNGGANMSSLMFALQRLGAEPTISDNPVEVQQASHVILPGVGHAADSMAKLEATVLNQVLLETEQPVLGICLGMQLLFEWSSEGDTPCLGIIEGRVERLPSSIDLPCPHMGWNEVTVLPNKQNASVLFADIAENSYFYFVHSYAAAVGPSVIAATEYGHTIASAVAHENYYGVQFHPERSGPIGATLLNNFLRL